MTVLVTGATGHVGRHVVDGLVAAGERVRAMSREPDSVPPRRGVEVVRGDLTDPAGLSTVLAGVDSLCLFPVPQTASAVLDRVRRAGVRRVVVLSSASVSHPDSHSGGYHRAVEQAVLDSGVDWTFVRPGEFATNLLWKWGRSIREEGVVRAPYASARQMLLHEADVAAVITAALLQEGHTEQVHELTGPELLTQADQVRLLSVAVGRELRFDEVGPERARAELLRETVAPVVDMVLAYLADARDDPPRPLPTVARLTGRPGLTFARWAADHADAFR